ncbi:hypothetical protein DH2020_009857 [Rehmannia glutinosa]|uniref:Protein kinase domain-containing protein n=1 Tax=Rehmannia glutinosa TaxID=99300 RepID=A0ABR0X9Q4_REHGL
MSAIYDNWERLVAAALKKEQLWQLSHAASMDTSIGSLGYTSSFSSSLPNGDFSYLQKLPENEEYEEPVFKNKFLKFNNSTAFDYEGRGIQKLHIETLGKEKFAVPYRSVMYNGITTVVKRLRGAERDVEENMEVSRLESYFSYKDEMLIFYEYQSQEGVSTMLHGIAQISYFLLEQVSWKKPGMYELDWEPRVRIAIAVAKAIANTHSQCNDNLAHGDTNAFPNSKYNDVFSDLGLENMARASIVIPTAGYCAPEINYDLQPSVGQASDIYSFGVLLIELTGAFPRNGSVISRMPLVRWIIHKFVEVGTLIVFELVPVRNPCALVEMWKMLLLAMWCVEENPKQRPKLVDVVKRMDDIKMCPF